MGVVFLLLIAAVLVAGCVVIRRVWNGDWDG
jgi:hypothetical protein